MINTNNLYYSETPDEHAMLLLNYEYEMLMGQPEEQEPEEPETPREVENGND